MNKISILTILLATAFGCGPDNPVVTPDSSTTDASTARDSSISDAAVSDASADASRMLDATTMVDGATCGRECQQCVWANERDRECNIIREGATTLEQCATNMDTAGISPAALTIYERCIQNVACSNLSATVNAEDACYLPTLNEVNSALPAAVRDACTQETNAAACRAAVANIGTVDNFAANCLRKWASCTSDNSELYGTCLTGTFYSNTTPFAACITPATECSALGQCLDDAGLDN